MKDADGDARRVKIETATHEKLIDMFRPPFTESKGRVRTVLTDILFEGAADVWRERGREDYADWLHGQVEEHLEWEREMQELEEAEHRYKEAQGSA